MVENGFHNTLALWWRLLDWQTPLIWSTPFLIYSLDKCELVPTYTASAVYGHKTDLQMNKPHSHHPFHSLPLMNNTPTRDQKVNQSTSPQIHLNLAQEHPHRIQTQILAVLWLLRLLKACIMLCSPQIQAQKHFLHSVSLWMHSTTS